MSSRTILVLGGVAILAAIGCSDAGVTSVAPVVGGSGGSSVAGTPARPATPIAGTPATPSTPPVTQAGTGAPPAVIAGTGATPAPSAGTSATPPSAGTGSSVAGAPAVAGMSAAPVAGSISTVAGAPGGAAGSTGAAGSSEPPGKCPAGWDCIDLSSFGATAVDGAGKPITFSCGNGELTDCKDADPKGSCKALTNPFCAHVNVAGMDLVSCGQLCTP